MAYGIIFYLTGMIEKSWQAARPTAEAVAAGMTKAPPVNF
jgi:hypothetical protein